MMQEKALGRETKSLNEGERVDEEESSFRWNFGFFIYITVRKVT